MVSKSIYDENDVSKKHDCFKSGINKRSNHAKKKSLTIIDVQLQILT